MIFFYLFLYQLDFSGVQEKMGIMNRGVVYALWDYTPENPDELSFREGDCMTIVRREDEDEIDWWWARLGDMEGYIPRNLLGVSYEPLQSILKHKNCNEMFALLTCMCSQTALSQNQTKTKNPGMKLVDLSTAPHWQKLWKMFTSTPRL